MKEIASIDIGSNTVRLLILQADSNGRFRQVESIRTITRLGEGMESEKRLPEKRMQATLAALAGFRDRCRKRGPIPIHAVATSAVREAANRDEFLRRVLESTGIEVEVISWEEEARLTLEGVFWKLPLENKKVLVFDIGGGSTEFILAKGKNICEVCGTSLGTVRLTEKFISRHPVDPGEYSTLENFLNEELGRVQEKLSQFAPEVWVGTAGTVTTLAALDANVFPYDPEKIHGSVLPFSRILELQNELRGKGLAERLQLKPLEKGREDLIVAGTAIVLATMRAFDCDLLTVSEYSLREGIALKALGLTSPGTGG